MDNHYHMLEIAYIIHDFYLVDSESNLCIYTNRHDRPYGTGYYVVNWPEHIQVRQFNDQAAFHGPFNTRKEALLALEWMQNARSRETDDDWSGWKPWVIGFPLPIDKEIFDETLLKFDFSVYELAS